VTEYPDVLLVHGLASSFEHNWRATGWADILAGEGRQVIGMDLPGHGRNTAQDPVATGPAEAVLAALGDRPRVDAAGFSAGGHALLAAAASAPHRFRRIAVLGVGDPRPGDAASEVIAAGLESADEPDDQTARVIRRLADGTGNDRRAVAAYFRARPPALTRDELARIDLPVLVVLGDRDFAAPADMLLGALPDASLVTLREVDHFGTPADYACIEAVTSFLAR
jgi:pimeloyl-ACP methyl ester carboxylesterase